MNPTEELPTVAPASKQWRIERFLWVPLDHRGRWLVAVAAGISAVAHIPVIGPHLNEAPYMGEEFIVLTISCLLIAAAVLYLDSPAVYSGAVLTCGLAVIGYVLTRLVAFPMLSDDVGNWFEPLGVVSVLAESTSVAVSLYVLRRWSGSALHV